MVVNVLKYADNRVSKDDVEPRAYVDKLFYDIKFSKATQTAKVLFECAFWVLWWVTHLDVLPYCLYRDKCSR